MRADPAGMPCLLVESEWEYSVSSTRTSVNGRNETLPIQIGSKSAYKWTKIIKKLAFVVDPLSITFDAESDSTNNKTNRSPSTSHDLDRLSLTDVQVTCFENESGGFRERERVTAGLF